MSEEPIRQADPPPATDESIGNGHGVEGQVAPEVSRRVSTILDAVEHEAARLRGDAQEEARRYLDYSRRRADSLVAERQRRISELSDEILTKAEAVATRLEDAAPVREGFENLVRALGDAAERLSQEAERTRGEFAPPAFHDEAIAVHTPPPPARPSEPAAPGAPAPAAAADPYAGAVAGPDPGPPAIASQQPAGVATAAPADSQPPLATPAPVPGAEPAPRPQVPHPPAQRPPVDEAKLVAIQMAASGRTRGEVGEHLRSVLGVADGHRMLDEVFGAGSAEDSRVPWTSAAG